MNAGTRLTGRRNTPMKFRWKRMFGSLLKGGITLSWSTGNPNKAKWVPRTDPLDDISKANQRRKRELQKTRHNISDGV